MAKLPGIGIEESAVHREVLATHNGAFFLPAGRIIEGVYARDPDNADPSTLRAGLLMGKETTDKNYRPSILGVLQANCTAPYTTITVTPAQAVEIVRRIGPTGTLAIYGPTASVPTSINEESRAYTVVNTANGAITIAAVNGKLAGSLVCAVDGTSYPRTFITDPYGIKVTDEYEANIDAAFEQILVAGIVKVSQLIVPVSANNTAQTTALLTAWVKTKLRVAVPGLIFDDDF